MMMIEKTNGRHRGVSRNGRRLHLRGSAKQGRLG